VEDRPGAPCPDDRDVKMGLGRRTSIPANELRPFVHFDDVAFGKGSLVDAGGGDREAERIPGQDRAEVAARPERPPAALEPESRLDEPRRDGRGRIGRTAHGWRRV
jgi:hypothetical protein